MTDKDIAAMREDAEEARKVISGSYTIPREGVEALAMDYATQCAEQMPLVLDEVERLRAENAGLQRRAEKATTYNSTLMSRHADALEIVRAVADCDPIHESGEDGFDACTFCEYWMGRHDTTCAWAKARALLGMENK